MKGVEQVCNAIDWPEELARNQAIAGAAPAHRGKGKDKSPSKQAKSKRRTRHSRTSTTFFRTLGFMNNRLAGVARGTDLLLNHTPRNQQVASAAGFGRSPSTQTREVFS